MIDKERYDLILLCVDKLIRIKKLNIAFSDITEEKYGYDLIIVDRPIFDYCYMNNIDRQYCKLHMEIPFSYFTEEWIDVWDRTCKIQSSMPLELKAAIRIVNKIIAEHKDYIDWLIASVPEFWHYSYTGAI